LDVLSLMYRMLVTPTVISYNAAVSACGKGCAWERALDVLSLMPRVQ